MWACSACAARSGLNLDKPAQRALHWHLANLEFACAAPLTTVSAQDWDQDDENEYDGDHMILCAPRRRVGSGGATAATPRRRPCCARRLRPPAGCGCGSR